MTNPTTSRYQAMLFSRSFAVKLGDASVIFSPPDFARGFAGAVLRFVETAARNDLFVFTFLTGMAYLPSLQDYRTGRRKATSTREARRSPNRTAVTLQFREPGRGLPHIRRKIFHLLDLADLDDFVVRSGTALGPGYRLLLRSDVDHPVASQHLFRLGERPVRDFRLSAGKRNSRAHRG